MLRLVLFIFYLVQIFSFILGTEKYISNYYSLDNSLEYNAVEYLVIKSNPSDLFILNQPYANNKILNFFNDSNIISSNLKKRYEYLQKNKKQIRFNNEFGLNNVNYHKGSPLKAYIKIKSIFDFDNFVLTSSIDLDKSLKDDLLFHGDTKEWATAYIFDSYVLYKNMDIEFFGGRIARNFGILNEHSLIFSNNPYPFDHYGFSVGRNKMKYSFYISRLNNVQNGIDLQGIVIENEISDLGDTLLNVQDSKRYFSIQRLDFKLSKKIQGALSASAIYGGPNQSFEGEYLNPMNIFYLSQRNSQIQMNNLYQLNLFYNVNNTKAFYMDFLIDDIIVNNEEGYNGTDYKDNRFGLVLKYSQIDFLRNKNLFSLVYSKIWNETYLSYRNFENYVFFNKKLPDNMVSSVITMLLDLCNMLHLQIYLPNVNIDRLID